jgi:palmitoyltransferase ZDHHC2/15/20
MLPPHSTTPPRHDMIARTCARRCERSCCGIITYFPLALIYGATTWAVWVELNISLLPDQRWRTLSALAGVVTYVLLNWSYTAAVFTDPGCPARTNMNVDDILTTSITVKANGEMRFCNKCQAPKPDRAHHCSTCRRCVMKMDHHCPWLATCVGFRNYKAFLLFLIYLSLFSWLCFWASGSWLYHQILIDGNMNESSLSIHFVILSVISGIIGLVMSGFTAYHIYLTSRNLTTLENLEKTRYLSPLKSQIADRLNQPHTYEDSANPTLGEQLRDLGTTLTTIHANALPGVLRPEEGEELSPATASLRRNIDLEAQRERDQYNEYLDERDSAKLPHAFNLGWKRNMLAVFGPSMWLWGIPVSNSIGDGWRWEINGEFRRERERLRREREAEMRRVEGEWHARQSVAPPPVGRRRHSPYRNDIPDSSDEEDIRDDGRTRLLKPDGYENWNDVPDEMFTNGRNGRGFK